MRIEVTQEHIDSGRRCSVAACPVALAIQARLPQPCLVVVRDSLVTIGATTIRLPKAVTRRIKRFDTRQGIRPFTFELNI